MKPKFFLPLISLTLLFLSLAYAISYKSSAQETGSVPIPTGIQYMEMGAPQASFAKEQITADSMVLWVSGYYGSEDMRLEFKNGRLLKRNYLQPGTKNSLIRYQTFEYSVFGNLKRVHSFSYHKDRAQLSLNSTRYFSTDWSGNIKSSYLKQEGSSRKNHQREYCWKNGNVAKCKTYNSRGHTFVIQRIKYDQHINPMFGLNIYPDDPVRQSLNNPIEISSERFLRGTRRLTSRKPEYLYHQLGTTMGQVNSRNGKLKFYYLYE